MRRIFVHNLTAWPAERLSSRVLYVLVGITGVVFVLFWLVGFNLPFDDDPNFTAPLFTNLLLALIYVLTFIGIGMGVWSVLRTLKVRGKSESVDNNIPTRKIGYAVVLTRRLVTAYDGQRRELYRRFLAQDGRHVHLYFPAHDCGRGGCCRLWGDEV